MDCSDGKIGFVKSSDTYDYHMDVGDFQKYLESHACVTI